MNLNTLINMTFENYLALLYDMINKVNDIRFVGHPVSLEPAKDEDGHWTSNITMFQIVFALKVRKFKNFAMTIFRG